MAEEELLEGVGESSSPVRSLNAGSVAGYGVLDEVYNRLIDNGNEEALSNPDLRLHLNAHFNRFPARYALDVDMNRVEDVLLHQKLLAEAKDPEKRPVFEVRFLESIRTKPDEDDDIEQFTAVASTSRTYLSAEVEGSMPSTYRNVKNKGDFESCSMLGDLNLDVVKRAEAAERLRVIENLSGGHEVQHVSIHEIIFSTIDKPKLLSQLSALLSDIGLNIREAHAFSTIDGFSLDVFVVDGWPVEDTDGLREAVRKAVSMSEGSWSGSSLPHSVIEKKALAAQMKPDVWEFNIRLLKIGEKIASGSYGDLYHGLYLGNDVAVKILKSEHLNTNHELEFAQEVMMLRKVQHRNIVRFIGACMTIPQLCIITEYMSGGSVHDFLQKHRNVLELPLLLNFAIDVCKGMEYLHGNNIIHRDLKTANLLIDAENGVVKVADLGVAKFEGGVMTAETGTYRWMAPEVLAHEPYGLKADVYSFGIVLWELTTAKVPYDTMTPLQAAIGVRQGMRPDLPDDAHPRILELMQRCWEDDPEERPSFSEITVELEELLKEVVGE